MRNSLKTIVITSLILALPQYASAQRQQQALGRGVVVAKNGSNALVTWRRLAQEPEDATYNVYVNGTKLNSAPLTNTNYAASATSFPTGANVQVSLIDSNGTEGEKSVAYNVKDFDYRNLFVKINYEDGGSPLSSADFNTSYVWPVDLDGDGEMDYVVNRLNASNSLDAYVEGYLRTGEHLWTIQLGPNELSCSGQDDQICAYDIDCDGKGELIVQTSDGTRFWNPSTNNFGLYVNGSTTGDTDGDGIINYETQSTRNAPRYMSVVDGLTGMEKASVEQTYTSDYTRDNRSSLMGDEYNKHVGHVGVFFHDGIHPAVVMEWHTRESNGTHHYHNSAWAYDFTNGTASNWHQLFCEPSGAPAFHQIRVGDTDGDGKDEMIVGGYTMDHDGSMLFNTGIAHGDRFRTSDIDPERPGLETFAIQQYAGDMLGQILYDASTGEAIKKWYLSAVGDVGRGECMDIDPNHLGWEMWSTMGGVYDAEGDLIEGLTSTYPTEGLWWDAEPDREIVQTSDSHYNVYIQDYYKGREIQIGKESGYRYLTVYAKRAAFWGDIIGDWREEMILLHKENGVNLGIVGVTTDYTTDIDNIYCLQEDPHYRGDCTTKGYYQSPNPGFYLGYDMPRPQLPPCMVTDLIAKSGNSYTNYSRTGTASFSNGKSILFDLSFGTGTFTLGNSINPGKVYAMPVKGQTITLGGNGTLAGTMELWKSQQGEFVVNTNTTYTGKTVVSEGTLTVNKDITSSLVSLRARGTIGGYGRIGAIEFEGALNYEGCRIKPNGTLTFTQGMNIDKRVFAEFDSQSDRISVSGNLAIGGQLIINVKSDTFNPQPGTYTLLTCTGNITGGDNISVMGITGLAYEVSVESKSVKLVINQQRSASNNVVWNGSQSSTWDYLTNNFTLNNSSTTFVAGDGIVFNDSGTATTITVDDLMPAASVKVSANSKAYVFNGDGGISGTSSLTKEGNGTLTLNTTKSDYTGKTIINGGTVVVKSLADAGIASSLGAASSDVENIQIGNATLSINNSNTATDRGITLTGSANIEVNSGTTSLKGLIAGSGTLVKSGSGQLNITYAGSNTWTGGTVLNGGTLAMGTWNTTFGTSTSTITANGGRINIFDNNSSSAVPVFNNTVNVPSGSEIGFAGGSRCKIGGKFTGSGTVNIWFPYVRGDFYSDMSGFNGRMNVTSGQFRLTSGSNMQGTTLSLGSGVYVVHTKSQSGTETTLTTSIGAVESTTADCSFGSGIWNVGYLGTDASFAGSFASSATLNKYGNGTQTLSGASSCTINVYAGAIDAETTESAVTSGTINVKNGGALIGSGKAQTVIIESGGTLGAGTSTETGTLTIDGALTVNGTIKVKADMSDGTYDSFTNNGTTTLNSPVFNIEPINGTWTATKEIKVFSGSITLSGTPTFSPEIPATGFVWDYSRLASEGVIVAEMQSNYGSTIYSMVKAIYDNENYTETTSGARSTFGTALDNIASQLNSSSPDYDAINTQLKEATLNYIAGARPTGTSVFDISFLISNSNLDSYWDGTWNIKPAGWQTEQNGGNFQVMNNSRVYSSDGTYTTFMEYWSASAATDGFTLYQQVYLPVGKYKFSAQAFAQFDNVASATVKNITFSTDNTDGNLISSDILSEAYIDFVQTEARNVAVGLKAHAGNQARWMGIGYTKLYMVADDSEEFNTFISLYDKVKAIYDVEDYEEEVAGVHNELWNCLTTAKSAAAGASTQAEWDEINTNLKNGAINYITNASPTGNAEFDISFLLNNNNLDNYWDGTWNIKPDGWLTEQNGGNFQVMNNSRVYSSDGTYTTFMEYWSETAATDGFTLYQNVNLPEGIYRMEAQTFAQFDNVANATVKNITFSANETDGSVVSSDILSTSGITFRQTSASDVKIGLKAHSDNQARWMGIGYVSLYKSAPKDIILADDTDYIPVNTVGNVTLQRNVDSGKWTSIVLPFDLSSEQVSNAFGSETRVAEYCQMDDGSGTGIIIFMGKSENSIEANVPVIIYPENGGNEFYFDDVTIKEPTNSLTVEGASYNFTGFYSANNILDNGSYYISSNFFTKAGSSDAINGFRAAIIPKSGAGNIKLQSIWFNDESTGETTNISNINGTNVSDGSCYTISGIKVDKPTEKGIYIQNGKKIFIK